MQRRDELLERLAFLLDVVDEVPGQASAVIEEARQLAEELGLGPAQLEALLNCPKEDRRTALRAAVEPDSGATGAS